MTLNKTAKIAALCIVVLSLVATSLDAQQKLGVQVVDLRDGGFSPSSIHQAAGTFLLIVKNRSMATQFTVGIAVKAGAAVVAPVAFKSNNQDFLLTLPAGTYVVVDSEHPAWSPLTITVE